MVQLAHIDLARTNKSKCVDCQSIIGKGEIRGCFSSITFKRRYYCRCLKCTEKYIATEIRFLKDCKTKIKRMKNEANK